MSNLSFEKLWSTLSKYNIKLKTDLDPNLMCMICGNILIDSQLTLCQCQFCQKCIKKYLDAGQQFCPGKKDECKWEYLSRNINFNSDKVTNKKISMLIGICPHEQCNFECELNNMADHIRICKNKYNSCPFYEIGCKLYHVSESEINNHLNTNQETHSKLLIQLINNLSNELKRIEDEQKTMTKNFKIELVQKDEQIKMMNKAMDETFIKLNHQIKNENRGIMEILTKLQNENEHLKSNLEKSNELIEILRVELKLAGMKLLGQTGLILWKIDQLFEKKLQKSVLLSEYFYSYDGHKLSLYFYPFGVSKEIKDEHLSIKLSMSNFQCNQSISFSSDALVEIFDQSTGEPVCKIKQANIFIKKGHASFPFNFIYSDFSESVLKNNSILIRCSLH